MKISEEQLKKDLAEAAEIIKMLQDPAVDTPLYKIIRKFQLKENRFRLISYAYLISPAEYQLIMSNRAPRVANKIIQNLPPKTGKIINTIDEVAKRRTARQQKIDDAHEQKMTEFKEQQDKTITVWHCLGCGINHYPNKPPFCRKCLSLYFEQIEVPVIKKQQTEAA